LAVDPLAEGRARGRPQGDGGAFSRAPRRGAAQGAGSSWRSGVFGRQVRGRREAFREADGRRVRRVPDPARLRPDRLSLPGRPGRGTIPLRRQERQYPGGELTAIDLRQVERVLVIMLRHHGDVLLTSPVFTALKRAAPQLEIDALVYADTSPMLLGHPAIAELHCV